jgi:hypothetical protein
VVVISCIWRIVSFKHTHLVERVGLLTLIIMGEGIIGMSKSVSKIIQNSDGTSSRDVGVIVSSVLLIYFIWILYFDQIENDRFGTIRQQVWAILHYPLHVAILLTVEGSTALILWNIIMQIDLNWWANWYPAVADDSYFANFTSAEAVTEYLQEALTWIAKDFRNGTFVAGYNATEVLEKFDHLNGTFPDESWSEGAGELVNELFTGVENFIFENFGIEVPEKTGAPKGNTADAEQEKNDALYSMSLTIPRFPLADHVHH